MSVDIHKPDTSTLVTTGHFYFGWTLGLHRIDMPFAIRLNCAHPFSVPKATDGGFSWVSELNESVRAKDQASSPKLLDRVRAAIRARHYSLRTEEAYVDGAVGLSLPPQAHPAEMGEPEINQFLTHLAVVENVAASTQNQPLSGILFLYQEVLGRDLDRIEGVVWAKKPKRLPVVLTRDEVRALLAEMSGTPKLAALFALRGWSAGVGSVALACQRALIWLARQITVRDVKDRRIG